jgi:hypothetical protein
MVAVGLKTPENALGYEERQRQRLRRENYSDASVDLVYPAVQCQPCALTFNRTG